jgi:carbon storage regulator
LLQGETGVFSRLPTANWKGSYPMLVLTRKPNQSIMIGDDIEVSVLSVAGEKVRIGIHAPQDVPVFRTEIYVELEQSQPHERERANKDVRAEVDDALTRLRDSNS